jgi:hypothetical protein
MKREGDQHYLSWKDAWCCKEGAGMPAAVCKALRMPCWPKEQLVRSCVVHAPVQRRAVLRRRDAPAATRLCMQAMEPALAMRSLSAYLSASSTCVPTSSRQACRWHARCAPRG